MADPEAKAAHSPRQSGAGTGRQPGLFLSPHLPPEMCRTSRWSAGQFDLQQTLASGKNSELHLAMDRQSGMPVALKLYHKKKLSAINKVQVGREIALQTQLSHDNIIKLYAAFEDEKYVYLVQELATGGDLFQKVRENPDRRLPEQQLTSEVMRPLLSALCYLHERGIVHRDIKPENIVIDSEDNIKLADFGLAINAHDERPVTRAGTLDYMAPEVLICPDKDNPMENKDQEHLAYAEQVDIWAAGILAWELLVGRPPFEQTNSRMTFEHILNMEPEFPDWMSRDACSFIKAALCKDARSRPTARLLLSHRWLQPGGRRRSRASSLLFVGGSSGGVGMEAAGGLTSGLSEVALLPTRMAAAFASGGPLTPDCAPSVAMPRMSPQAAPDSPKHRPPAGVLSDDTSLAQNMSRFAVRSPITRLLPGELGSDRLAQARMGLERALTEEVVPPGRSSTCRRAPSVDYGDASPQASKYSNLFSKLWGGGKSDSGGPADASPPSRIAKSGASGLAGREKSLHNMALARDKSISNAGRSASTTASRDKSMSPMTGREKSVSIASSPVAARERGAAREAVVGRERSVGAMKYDQMHRGGLGKPPDRDAAGTLKSPSLAINPVGWRPQAPQVPP